MTKLYSGVEFNGNPDEQVWVTPQTVYDSIPEDQTLWRYRYANIVNKSFAPQLLTKGEIFDYALNAYAKKSLPQYFYQLFNFYQASQFFLIDSDLRLKDSTIDQDFLAFWEVKATVHKFIEEDNEDDPCIVRYGVYPGKDSYFGRPPYVDRVPPPTVPCFNDRVHYRILERGPDGPWIGGWQFNYRFFDGTSSNFVAPNGVSIEATTLEVTEGGLIFVSLPELPSDIPEPPPLVGVVVDRGPPGPRGPQGVPGPAGTNGGTDTGSEIATKLCALSDPAKDELKECLNLSEGLGYYAAVFAASPTEIKEAQQIILETAPEIVVPRPEILLTEEGPATLETLLLEEGGWAIRLVLPFALLVGLKLLQEKIKVATCLDRGRKFWKEVTMPVWSIGAFSQKQIYQELFNQLSWLLRCCPPCETDSWILFDTAFRTYLTNEPKNYDAVMLRRITDDGPEVNSWYGTSSIHKYGEFRWIWNDHKPIHLGGEVQRFGKLEFWNSREQVFEAHSGNVFGFQIDLEVEAKYEIWIRKINVLEEGLEL